MYAGRIPESKRTAERSEIIDPHRKETKLAVKLLFVQSLDFHAALSVYIMQ